MGYCATGSGYAIFSYVNRAKAEDILDHLASEFDDPGFMSGDIDTDGQCRFDFYAYEKYHEDRVMDVLDYLASIGGLVEGVLEYLGEDGCHWRFLYVREMNRWVEQAGRVVYE